MSAALKGKQMHKLTYDSLDHNERLNWLRKNASLDPNLLGENAMEVSDDG